MLKICVAMRLIMLLALGGVLMAAVAQAQFAGPAVSSDRNGDNQANSGVRADTSDLRIAPGDVLSINVFGIPELSLNTSLPSGAISNSGTISGVRTGAKGEVTLPYIGTIQLAGLTPVDAGLALRKALLDAGILTDPQVSVALVESPARVVAVLGEVAKPMPVAAVGRLRLLDAISACGGFTPLASHFITVHRLTETAPIQVEIGTDPRTASAANMDLQPGDTVLISRVGNVYVIGQVKTEQALPLAGNAPVTVLRALSMAGGVKFSAALSQARIIRTGADHQRIEIRLDLKRIMQGKDADVALASDDVLYVPTHLAKSTLAAGGASVAASLMYESAYLSTVLR